jgi:hypothetical protein
MPVSGSSTRRRYLTTAGLLLAGSIGGCTGDGSEGTVTSTETTATTTGSSGSADGTDSSTATATTAGTADGALDLREANVVAVAFEGQGDGRYRFDVTLHHDDEGEHGYANWWQVETMLGEQIGRRDLAHPHAEQPFTRSATLDVAAETTCIVVRGHDETHGYGGRAMIVNLELDTRRAVDQGPDRQRFAPGDCP